MELVHNELIDLQKRHIMAIINVTPDSFYEGSRTASSETIEQRIVEAVEAGATILDIGGYSSRPAATAVEIEEEWRRVALGCEVARSVAPTVAISIDTFRSEIVRRTVERFGAIIVNDITAGEGDREMVSVVAQYRLPYVAMHMRGTPETMQSLTQYNNVVDDVVEYFKERVATLRKAGVEQIVIDPGFGFAKSLEQNYELLAGLDRLKEIGCPVLVGVSRKSMIYRAIGCEPSEALPATIALGWEALSRGATILRVHDTAEAVQSLRIFEIYNKVLKGDLTGND
ncbi:MAG: dihydropteroate synthase [Rikenellaceae bacterium]